VSDLRDIGKIGNEVARHLERLAWAEEAAVADLCEEIARIRDRVDSLASVIGELRQIAERGPQ
jgi:ubiquinone biosynthesis protein UbiJ